MPDTIASPDSVLVSALQPASASTATAASQAARKASGPRRYERAHGRDGLLHVPAVDAVVRDHANAAPFVEAEHAPLAEPAHQFAEVPALRDEEHEVALRRWRQGDARNRR